MKELQLYIEIEKLLADVDDLERRCEELNDSSRKAKLVEARAHLVGLSERLLTMVECGGSVQ